MTTPTIAPPGWYVHPGRPQEPRFWDGYQFPDQGVTVCPDGHEAAQSAVFCPGCGAAVGAVPLEALTAHAYRRRRDDHAGQGRLRGAVASNDPAPQARPGRLFSARRGARRQIARAGAGLRRLVLSRLSAAAPKVVRDTPGRFVPATRD